MAAHIVVRFRGRDREMGEMLQLLSGGRRRAALEALRDMADEALEGLQCATHQEGPTLVLASTNPAHLRGRLVGCCEGLVVDGLARLESAFPDARLTGEARAPSRDLTLH